MYIKMRDTPSLGMLSFTMSSVAKVPKTLLIVKQCSNPYTKTKKVCLDYEII